MRRSLVNVLAAAVTVGGLLAACGGAAAPTGTSSSATSAAKGGTGAVSGPLTPAQTKGMTLIIEGWGGAWTNATKKFADHFAREYGVTIEYPTTGEPSTLLHLQEQSGNVQMDVVDTAKYLNYKQGDLATFPSWLVKTIKANVPAQCVSTFSISCYGDTAYVIACNPAIVHKCPTNAAEFWDVKDYPGPRAFTAGTPPEPALLFAEMAYGTPKSKLYPIDMKAAIAKLKKIKPYVKVWPTSGGQQEQVLINKEVGIEYGWNGRMYVVKQHNIPNLQISWNDSVVSGPGNGLMVAKNAPHEALAFTFLNWWVQQAKLQAAWSTALTYPTPNTKVNSLLAPDILASMPFAPDHAQPVPQHSEYQYQHLSQEEKAFQQFLTGN